MCWSRMKKSKEIKYTYVPFLVYIIAQHILMYYVNDWDWWKTLMDGFAGYSS